MKIETEIDFSHYGDMREWVEEKLDINKPDGELIEPFLRGYDIAQELIDKCFDIAKVIGIGCQSIELYDLGMDTHSTREYLEEYADSGMIKLFTDGPVYYIIY